MKILVPFILGFICKSYCSSNWYEVIRIPVDRQIQIGDTPYWDKQTQSLYFVDFGNPNATICRYDYDANYVFCATVVNQPSASSIIPIKGQKNEYAVGIQHGIKVVVWNGREPSAYVSRVVFNVEENTQNLMHSAKTDPTGRLYAETFAKGLCGDENADSSLYTYSKKTGVNQVVTGFKANGGLAWNKKKGKFYHMNGCEQRIYEYDWNKKSGNLSNNRIAFDFNANEKFGFFPSGLDIDRDGFLYTSIYEGSLVCKIDPRASSITSCYDMPVALVTSPTFGGPNLNELFATSGYLDLDFSTGKPKENQPMDEMGGSLFKIIGLGSKGYAGERPFV